MSWGGGDVEREWSRLVALARRWLLLSEGTGTRVSGLLAFGDRSGARAGLRARRKGSWGSSLENRTDGTAARELGADLPSRSPTGGGVVLRDPIPPIVRLSSTLALGLLVGVEFR